MDLKRLSAAALALTLGASLVPAALAADERPTPTLIAAPISAGVPTLISANPNAGSFNKTISVNGEVLTGYDYDKEVPGWGSETVSVLLSEIPNAPAGYLPLRAIIQADGGSAYWNKEDSTSSFYLRKDLIFTDFNDMSIKVNDEVVKGEALLLEGVTYVPSTVLDLLDGVSVTDNSADGAESYEIATPNGTPLMKLANALLETAGLGRGMQATPTELEEFYGESHGFKAEYMTEGVAFLPMMTSPDTLVVGKAAEGKLDTLKECFEAYRKSQEETFSWYLSQNLPKVENAQFVTEGDWFLFVIAENADETVEQFRAQVAEMK